MEIRNADVIVVGLGPIGAYAAWKFAQSGLSVLGLEKQKEDAGASEIGAFHFEHLAFERTGVPLPKEEDVLCTYPNITLHSPDGNHEVQVDGVETWALDLDKFISNLRSLAVAEGATFTYGARVTDVLLEDGKIAGVQVKKGNGEISEYRATLVVDATGMARAVRKHIPSMSFPGDDSLFSVYMEYWTDPENKVAEGIHSYAGPNAWTAKYPEYWIVGMGGPMPMERLKEKHAVWVEKNLPGEKTVIKAVTGLIPFAYFPPTFVDDGFLVLGDAAGTNKPFNGEGIASGMELAKIAAGVVPDAVKNGAGKKALWEINRRYFTDLGAKFAFIRALSNALLTLDEKELSEAFAIGLIQGEDMRQTFLDYEVQKPLIQWLGPLAQLLLRPAMAVKYAKGMMVAASAGKLFKSYPSVEGYQAWAQRFRKLVERSKVNYG